MKKKNLIAILLGTFLLTACDGFGFNTSSSSNQKDSSDYQSTNSVSSSVSNQKDSSTSESNNYQSTNSSSSSITDGNSYKKLDIKNTVQELEYVEGALPSIGNPKALVIPVEFPDCTAKSKGYSIELIDKAFNGESSEMEWESVNSYFKKSSYGKVDVQFDVMNSWFTTSKKSTYYASYKDPKGEIDAAELIIKEYLTANPHNLKFSDYDTNNDGYIDSIYLIYTHDVDYNSSDTIWWAYQYYYINEDYFDNVTPYYYMFAGYEFMFEDDMECNTHTYIHESGHLFGLEDYYDYDSNQGTSNGGLAGADIMDYTVGDHNPFSKMLLGWAANPMLITTQDSVTINLEAFQKSGDFVILANNWDESKGMYQEYFIVEYWTPTGLNEYDSTGDYLYSQAGVRVLHVTATLENNNGYDYFKYDNSYTNIKLITLVPANGRTITSSTTANNAFLYRPNSNATFSGARYNNRSKLGYEFTVNSLGDTYANITFTKI